MKLISKFNRLLSDRPIEIMLTIVISMPLTLTLSLMINAVITIITSGLNGELIFQFMLGFIYSVALAIFIFIFWKD